MATITSAGSGPWTTGATWGGGVKPGDDDTVVIAAGHSVEFDEDMSGWANGIAGLTITSHATTPAMLYAKHSADGTYHLKLKTGTTIAGTDAAARGRLLANSDGVWGNTGSLPFGRKFIIELAGTARIVGLYLDIALRCTEPTVKSVLVTGHTVSSAVITTTTDVTGDAQWAAGAAVVLSDVGPEDYDQQRTTLSSVDSATQITLGATVDSAQYNGAARVWLMTRNVAVRSSCTSNVFIVDYSNASHGGVFACEIRSTAGTGTTFYGRGINYGSGHTVSGTVSGCICGINYGSGYTVSGTVSGCSCGINYGSGHTVSGTVSGCTYGIYYGSGHTVSGTVSGCSCGIYYGSGHTVSGTVSGCSCGISYGSAVLKPGATFSTNTNDIYVCLASGRGAALNSATQNGFYKFSQIPLTGRYDATVLDLGGTAGAIGAWSNGGFCKSAAYSEGTHAAPPVASALIHEQKLEDSRAITYVEVPLPCVPGQLCTVTFYGRLSTTSDVSVLPAAQIVDPALAWQGSDVLASESMASSTDWQTLTLSHTPTDSRPLVLRVQATGGNASGTGTGYLFWFHAVQDPVLAAIATVDTVVDAIKAKTDALPADPADQSAVEAAITAAHATTNGKVDAVKADVNGLPTAAENADALLGRNIGGGSSTGRLVKDALRFLRNKWSVDGATLTVYQEDDSTPAWTSTLATSRSAEGITGSDPAGP